MTACSRSKCKILDNAISGIFIAEIKKTRVFDAGSKAIYKFVLIPSFNFMPSTDNFSFDGSRFDRIS